MLDVLKEPEKLVTYAQAAHIKEFESFNKTLQASFLYKTKRCKE